MIKPVFKDNLIVVRGAGDIASGAIYALYKAGFPVIILDIANPSAIRRKVAFCEAVFDGKCTLEGVTCTLVKSVQEARDLALNGELPLLIDAEGKSIEELKPKILVDAILAKINLGTKRSMADFVIGLGPGFTAGNGENDLHCVVETMRGHNLGRLIYNGAPLPNTGVPGVIAGVAEERVIHAPTSGKINLLHDIGDIVEKGEVLATIGDEKIPVPATISGVLRGIIRNEYPVTKGLKIADIDPRREQQKNCYTISDKSRSIGGSVLTAVMTYITGR